MQFLAAYWSMPEVVTNGLLMMHLAGSAAVGVLLGYERSYHGRAAGMRTYALVCITSTMLTVIVAYPDQWFGGHAATTPMTSDPTRIIQGLMTGIGFLGAGVIMKDGFTIRGLSTAASIWLTAAIGVIIGIGFYGAAISATAVALFAMTFLGRLERLLPHQTTLQLSLVYPNQRVPSAEEIRARMLSHGFEVIDWSFRYCEPTNQFQYDLIVQATGTCRSHNLVRDLSGSREVLEFRLAPSRA